ncbi:M28 family peptidase [Candidatus Methylacidithermus pantelleriae]|nr:M28 family peptidase [Candidatus Methylacidithermus pantelleriae]
MDSTRDGGEPFPPGLREVVSVFLALPTAPLWEGAIKRATFELLEGVSALQIRDDGFGNLWIVYGGTGLGAAQRHRVVLVAHMDHPGLQAAGGKEPLAYVLGGVSRELLLGSPVLWYDKHYQPVGQGRIVGIVGDSSRGVCVELDRIPKGGVLGMWDLGRPRWGSQRFSATACDDLVGVATLLWLAKEVAQKRANVGLTVILTRAEEIGLRGARWIANGRFPKDEKVPIVSLEASQARGWAQLGEGFVVRVGDRRTIFEPQVTDWILACCERAKQVLPWLRYQRRLLGGGTCEATAFAEKGYLAGGLALPLEHYHNESTKGKLARESVSLSDWTSLAHFLTWWTFEGSHLSWERWTQRKRVEGQ